MSVDSPFSDVAVPETALPAALLDRADDRGDATALIDAETGRSLSFEAFAARVRSLAAGLSSVLDPGDVVALHAPNGPSWAVAFHAAALAGAAVAPVGADCTAAELRTRLGAVEPRLLVTTGAGLDAAAPAAADAGVGRTRLLDGAAGADAPPLADLRADGPAPAPPAPDAVAALPFTSGTTGRPRAVELTHRNLLGNVRQVAGVVPPTLGPDDVSVGVLPFSHSYGLTVGLNHALHAGATLVTLPRFEPAAFLDALATHRVTVARVVPPLVGLLADHPAVADRDLDALETVLSGAATLDPAVADACADRLDCRVVQGYGLTEASPVTHYTPHDDVRRGRVGPPVPNTACRVVDPDDGTPLDAGEVGAVEVRGPQVARGYHGADAPPLAPDGWLSTGDLGRLDADGFLRVCGRTGDAVAYKGHTVAPAEPEAVLRRHPSVADAAVVAAPDDEAGEVPVARVVPAPDADLDPDALLAFAAERLSAPRRPRAVTAVDTLPRTDAGKLRRAAVRDRARDRDEDRPSDR